MTLLTGEITEIFVADFATQAKVKVGGAFMRSPLFLLPDACVGDAVLIDGGVIISRIVADRLPDGEVSQQHTEVPQ